MDFFNLVMKALSIGLDTLFPDVPIFPETLPEDVPPRCFLIGFAGEVELTEELSGRVRIAGQIDIAYLSPLDNLAEKGEMNKVFAKLALNLRIIWLGASALRLSKHTRRDVDGVLHSLCGFTCFLRRVDDTPPMTNIKIDKKELK